ncbi:MAG: two-component system response regulator [Ilumatobacteraceae bacterium]|nr:two-component system response regulator [Ilumatobacteraceae bacterium]
MRERWLNTTTYDTENRLNEQLRGAAGPRSRVATVCAVRVLVIEDEEAIRSVLDRGLQAEGFDVDVCGDGPSGLWRALEGGHAAIVLDLLLPGMSGYRVCEQLRAEGIATPILVLSAKSGEYDQIDLLDSGADDFLTKPASIALITARLRALIRRGASISSNLIERGALRYDLATRVCTVGEDDDMVELTLTNREDQLLRQLLLANGACVSRQQLLDDVWGNDSGTDASIVDIYLRKVRAKLQPVEIENVRGLGYRITAR